MQLMFQNGGWNGMEFLRMGTPSLLEILALLLWSLFWKGWALWLAARRGENVWFIVLLVVNTFGLLDIFYIFVLAKRSDRKNFGNQSTEVMATVNEEKIT